MSLSAKKENDNKSKGKVASLGEFLSEDAGHVATMTKALADETESQLSGL